MEGKEIMDRMQNSEKSFRMKYIDDMSDIIEDLNALQDVVETIIKVSIEAKMGEETLSGLNIINQSLGGIVFTINSRLENIE